MASTTTRTTQGRGRLYESILETVGDTPAVRVNNIGVDGVTIYVKAEFFNPLSSVKDRLAISVIEDAEHDIMERLLRLADRPLGVIMTHRSRADWLDVAQGEDALLLGA